MPSKSHLMLRSAFGARLEARRMLMQRSHLLTRGPLRRCDRVSLSVHRGNDLYANCRAGSTARCEAGVARARLFGCVIAGLVLAMITQAQAAICIENATINELRTALAAGDITAADLARAYLARIEAYDRGGPRLNAVRELNPDALAIAAALDVNKSRSRLPLEGIPILV